MNLNNTYFRRMANTAIDNFLEHSFTPREWQYLALTKEFQDTLYELAATNKACERLVSIGKAILNAHQKKELFQKFL